MLEQFGQVLKTLLVIILKLHSKSLWVVCVKLYAENRATLLVGIWSRDYSYKFTLSTQLIILNYPAPHTDFATCPLAMDISKFETA